MKRQDKYTGFSLIELLVVLVILGMLAGVVGPKVMKHLGSSKSKTALIQIKNFETTMEDYKLEVGNYPSTSDGLQALVTQPGDASRWNGPYMKKIPKDPWNNDYVYAREGAEFVIMSYGADGTEGGEKENKDISSNDG